MGKKRVSSRHVGMPSAAASTSLPFLRSRARAGQRQALLGRRGQGEKLLRHGEGWLASHPERESIARRYLKHRASLVDDALTRLTEADQPDPDRAEQAHAQEEAAIEERLSLNEQRLAALKSTGAKRVLDLG